MNDGEHSLSTSGIRRKQAMLVRFYPGGRVKFDDKGRRVGATLLIVQWQNGAPETVFPPANATAKPVWPKQ